MVCASTCILASALLGGFGLTSLLSVQKDGSAFQKSLSPEQLVKFKEIAAKRGKLATHGFLLGALLSLAYIQYLRFNKSTTSTKVQVACNVIAITLATTWAYYMLSPKGDHMVKYLTTPEQMDLFIDKNRAYQLRWSGGLILGAAGAYFLGKGLRGTDKEA
jgi:hypothetical protein